ncbi:MAG: UDP-N-acetylmuramyl-tripeptide synthetase [Pirellulales bacterium]
MTQQALPSAGTSLRELLAGDAQMIGSTDVRAAGCTSQARHVRPGDVFIALTEADADGHDDASEAARRGAAAIVCERPLPLFDVPQFVVTDSRKAYGRLCQALVGDPSQQLKVIGVAGSHGKTTVARLLTSIFREARTPAGTLDSFGYWDGCEDGPPPADGLSHPLLAKSLAEMAVAGASHAIVEIDSRELSRAILAGVTLDATCITHIGRRHLDWHGSVENYRQAERRIVEHLASDAVVILNADDPSSMRLLADLNQPALTFGLRQPAEITAQIIEQLVNEQTFILTAGDESAGVRTEMIGDHHVYNCLAAAATCLAYGIELTTIARGLEAVDHLPGRMQRVMCGQEYAVFVDAAQSPDSLRACLKAARQVTTGRLICVFGAPGEQESLERPVLGRVAGSLADVPIVTSAWPGGVVPLSILADIRRGFAAPDVARLIPNRTEAIAFALRAARAGDTVVVAGLGDALCDAPDDDDTPTNDCEIIRSLLRSAAHSAPQYRQAA